MRCALPAFLRGCRCCTRLRIVPEGVDLAGQPMLLIRAHYATAVVAARMRVARVSGVRGSRHGKSCSCR